MRMGIRAGKAALIAVMMGAFALGLPSMAQAEIYSLRPGAWIFLYVSDAMHYVELSQSSPPKENNDPAKDFFDALVAVKMAYRTNSKLSVAIIDKETFKGVDIIRVRKASGGLDTLGWTYQGWLQSTKAARNKKSK